MADLLATEKKARWVSSGTWSDSGISPYRLCTKSKAQSFGCSIRGTYSSNQIVRVKDLYYSFSSTVSCTCNGDCGHIGNTHCGSNSTSVWGCQCYTGVSWNTTSGTGCCSDDTAGGWFNRHGNCGMNGCNSVTCGPNNCGNNHAWCSHTLCNDYCPCAYGYHNCQNCDSGNPYTIGSSSGCRNCTSDQSNSCHCNSGDG